MRCEAFQEWLREVTSYPTPRRIAKHLREELASLDAAREGGCAVVGAESPRHRHLRRCTDCRGRVREALKYWSLLALYAQDVMPGTDLELRVRARMQADKAAGLGPCRELVELAEGAGSSRLGPPSQGRRFKPAATPVESRFYEDVGGGLPVVGWLFVCAGAKAGEDLKLAPGENVIGSAQDGTIVLSDATVSPRHISIVCAASGNGVDSFLLVHPEAGQTLYNNAVVDRDWLRLLDNDVIRLGAVSLKFKSLVGVPEAF